MAIDKIGSKALVDCSVAAADIAPGTITGTQLAGSIANAKLANSTVTINGTAIALGASASIAALAWQSVVVSDGSTVTTMVAGRGYFVNNTSAAGIVKLPASASAGDTIAIKDYAGNFATNKLTIQRNSHKIQGNANDGLIATNRASLVLVYIDATKGWLYTNESNVADLQAKLYVTATGGTIATSGDFKIHSFTGDGNFVVSCGGNTAGNNKVDYLVVAGGGAGGPSGHVCGGGTGGGAGGAGGYRESYTPAISGPYTASPLKAACGALAVTAQTYPVTVGGGGASGSPTKVAGGVGSNSVFSTITSTGGGQGAGGGSGTPGPGGNGGSGGGAGGANNPTAGTGNTPPVSPPQGRNGGSGGGGGAYGAGGGGGAGAVGGDGDTSDGGSGGAGVTSGITGSNVARAGGGGGGTYNTTTNGSGGSGGGGPGGVNTNTGTLPGNDGPANLGGGGGGGTSDNLGNYGSGGVGGKGVVIIRYKFQN